MGYKLETFTISYTNMWVVGQSHDMNILVNTRCLGIDEIQGFHLQTLNKMIHHGLNPISNRENTKGKYNVWSIVSKLITFHLGCKNNDGRKKTSIRRGVLVNIECLPLAV